jgi:protein-glucosylgalactosylhydroxylysine glucosidase
MAYKKSHVKSPISPAPMTEYQPDALPAYLSNGMMGLRVRPIPLHAGLAVINGCAGVHPVIQVTSTPFAPYPLSGDIRIEQAWLSDALQQITYEEQRYDFSCGELHTRFRFTANGITARIKIVTFCSRSLPSLALQQVQIEVDQPCNLTLRATVDPNGSAGKWHSRTTRLPGSNTPLIDGSLRWEMHGGLSTCGIAYVTELLGTDEVQRSLDEWGELLPLATSYTFRGELGHTYTLYQIASMVPSSYHHEPDWQATRLVYLAKERGFDTIRQENRMVWEELWKGRVLLLGAEARWQAMADAAFFYLHTSIHPSSPSSTTPFGLAMWPNYNYYYGHIMWDLETFVVPPLLLTAPDAALPILTYRSDRLPAARSHAKLNGYRGIQFPWESSATYGEEAAPPMSPGNVFEHHVTLDVAFAFAQYSHVTGDEDFLQQQAWPILKGAAEWLESRVTRTKRGYEIMGVIGIAEAGKPVNNNAYTNIAAKVVLHEAVDLARRLGRTVPEMWEKIATHLVIPLDPETDVILNHDGYNPKEEGGTTPDALAAFFPLTYRPGEQIEQATLAYYLPLAEKYAGAPMLSALLGVYAARTGDRTLSTHLFEKGYADFLFEPFSNIDEVSVSTPDRPRVGPFITNLSGFLMSCLYGLTGLRLGPGDPETWCERPIVLPDGWEGIRVERIWVRGRPARLTANHGDEHAQIEFLES